LGEFFAGGAGRGGPGGRARQPDAPRRSQFAAHILTMSRQMRRLIEEMLELARKMETEMAESRYTGFYHQLRAEMDEFYRAKRRVRLVKENTEYEEDLYDEAV